MAIPFRMNRVIPVAMKSIPFDVQTRHLGVRDLLSLFHSQMYQLFINNNLSSTFAFFFDLFGAEIEFMGPATTRMSNPEHALCQGLDRRIFENPSRSKRVSKIPCRLALPLRIGPRGLCT